MCRMRSAMEKGKRSTLAMTKKPNETVKKEETTNASFPSAYHTFYEPADVVNIRSQLLNWYDKEKRELPWRTAALKEPDLDIRTYAVWVSEIMLQQTQVATVIDYYNRWMKRWPTTQDLAAASLEEVNQMWAGLGYYSRGKRLHEGAQKVVAEFKGQMPRTVESLKRLPGVGRYTAGAIGSIALGEVSGVVDGNVIRVLCRMRAIGADSTSPAVTEALWNLANTLVDPQRPGDFNQAMMELGARVCTPKGPLCSQCPLQSHCHSYRRVHIQQEANSKKFLGKLDKIPSTSLPDIEECVNPESCGLCPGEPWKDDLGVQNFPRKPAKKASRIERTLTCVAVRSGEGGEDQYLLTQRPNKGLLAGMWEFPSMLLEGENSEIKQRGVLCAEVGRILGVKLNRAHLHYHGEVVHIFSHIHQTYVVYSICVKDCVAAEKTPAENSQWLTRPALLEAAVSTGMKKILKLYESTDSHEVKTSKDGKRKKATVGKSSNSSTSKKTKPNAANNGSRQLSLSTFFKTVKE